MKCRYCGSTHNLITEKWDDSEGTVSDEPVDLCHDCVEFSDERRKARDEWRHFHPGEACPDIELPQLGRALVGDSTNEAE
jgi:hypothetical protein